MDARVRAAVRKLCGRISRKDYGGKMKCDELKYERIGDANKTYPASTLVIRKQFVDAAIAELKAENRKLRRALYKACANWARSERYTEATWHGDEHREELWAKVEVKCQAKAKGCK